MEPKSLIQIISEQEFLNIVQEPSQLFFAASNDFANILEGGGEGRGAPRRSWLWRWPANQAARQAAPKPHFAEKCAEASWGTGCCFTNGSVEGVRK